MNNAKEKFNQYVLGYDHNNKNIVLKHSHSFRVAKYAKAIAESLKLNDKQIYLAELIGLLHDIGRFDQVEKHNTFNDLKTFDHGDYGAKLLFEDGLIKNYHLDESDYPIIQSAIINHNKYAIDTSLNEEQLLFSKMIRDADKIDIFYLTMIGELKFDIDNKDISPKVLETFKLERTVKNIDVINKKDHIIALIALIFDINFEYALNHIKNNYLDKILINYGIDDDLLEIINNYFRKAH
jgi:putative nucleotidyltransferase with HDIG domain